jgi:diadenosine tetraphosphate (Ap4A) HIT family hydrolase
MLESPRVSGFCAFEGMVITALDPNCIFCKIIEGEIPADIVLRNENVVAFNDLNPQAPTHVLLIPTLHTENAAGLLAIVRPSLQTYFWLPSRSLQNAV